MDARFAVSFAPRRWSALGRFGRSWLGRDAATGEAVERFHLPGFTAAELAPLTAGPARCGWHAALKPPFRLAAGTTPGDLVAFAMSFAAARLPFEIPGLALEASEGSLALVPSAVPPLLAGLAEDCVRVFEPFRAPAEKPELARARRARLSPRQTSLLERWGHPFVMEEFRFRMTLARPLREAEGERMKAALERPLERLLRRAVAVDAVVIFVEPAPGEAFRELRRIPFAGAG